ncbi:MAG: ATP-binding cassette domain-containing protein [Propionibacteriaceae bacterium]|jgi:ABC-2 type transport system ATP-binding protein|nr:ATP-binding cassette domain-containing protein [Propionibacteriaceae bacterium]
MIEAVGLSKRYGEKLAVDGISFTVRPGAVTGFLGPNGAGKSTTMRMVVGLDAPTAGSVRVNGKAYRHHAAPLHEVGILLDAKAVHPNRSARDHLRCVAATHGISPKRVDAVIETTGLGPVAGKRAGQFSLGMGQRLGIATALLGDPETLILDEPVNGLDPEGVIWVRTLARQLGAQGRTVFISSHLMSEMSQTADHLIVLGRGRVLADKPMSQFIAESSGTVTRVRSPQASELAQALAGPQTSITVLEPGLLRVTGVDSAQIGDLAAAHGWALHENTPLQKSLEDAFLALTEGAVEYRSASMSEAGRQS